MYKHTYDIHVSLRGKIDKPPPKKDTDFEELKKMYKMAYDIHLKI